MNTKKYTFDALPSLLENEGKTILVRFGAEERKVVVNDGTMGASGGDDGVAVASEVGGEAKVQTKTVFDCYSVRIEQPISKDKIVDAIVSHVYPSDKMQAIINNHLLDSEDDEDYETHEAEYKEMQALRKQAKQVAKQVIAEYTEKYC